MIFRLCFMFLLIFVNFCPAVDDKPLVFVKQSTLKDGLTFSKQIKVGETLDVFLETPATGYLWKLKSSDFKQAGEPVVFDGKGTPGQPYFKVYQFRIDGGGVIKMELARPFGNPDAKSIEIQIKTKE